MFIKIYKRRLRNHDVGGGTEKRFSYVGNKGGSPKLFVVRFYGVFTRLEIEEAEGNERHAERSQKRER